MGGINHPAIDSMINGVGLVTMENGGYNLYVTTVLSQQVYNNQYQIKQFTISKEGVVIEEKELDFGQNQPNMIRASLDGRLLIIKVDGDTDSIEILDAQTFMTIGSIQAADNVAYEGAKNIILDAQFLPNSNGIIILYSDGTLHLYGVTE